MSQSPPHRVANCAGVAHSQGLTRCRAGDIITAKFSKVPLRFHKRGNGVMRDPRVRCSGCSPEMGARAHGRRGAKAPVGRCLRVRKTARFKGTETFPRARINRGGYLGSFTWALSTVWRGFGNTAVQGRDGEGEACNCYRVNGR